MAHRHSFTLATLHLGAVAPPSAFHWLCSVCTYLTIQIEALAEFCTFWPIGACQFLQQAWSQWALKATQRPLSHGWVVAALTVHAILHPPITIAWIAGWRVWGFFTKFSYLQKNSLSCSLILPWRCICLLAWVFLYCFHFFFLPCYFYSLLHFSKGFCWAWFPDQGRNSCRCNLSPFLASPTPSFSLMGLSPFYPVSW